MSQRPRKEERFKPVRLQSDHDLAWNLAQRLENDLSAFKREASVALLRKTDETLRHVDDAIESMYAVAKDLQ